MKELLCFIAYSVYKKLGNIFKLYTYNAHVFEYVNYANGIT